MSIETLSYICKISFKTLSSENKSKPSKSRESMFFAVAYS